MAKKHHEVEVQETIEVEEIAQEADEPSVSVERKDPVPPAALENFRPGTLVFYLYGDRKVEYPAMVQSINPDGSYHLAVFEMNSVRFTDAIEGSDPGNFVPNF